MAYREVSSRVLEVGEVVWVSLVDHDEVRWDRGTKKCNKIKYPFDPAESRDDGTWLSALLLGFQVKVGPIGLITAVPAPLP